MRREKRSHKISTALPVIIMFGIIAVSSGGYRSGYGSAGFLALQPTFPQFQRAAPVIASFQYGSGVIQPMIPARSSVGSVSFTSGANIIQPNIGTTPSFGSIRLSAAGGPIAPTYGPGISFTPIHFGYRAYSVIYPVETIYTTPTRALIKTDIGYRYSNVAYVDP